MTSSTVPRPGDGPPQWQTLADLLVSRAATHPDRPAATFLDDEDGEATLSYGELDRRARQMAAALLERGCAAGDRALLLFPPGLEFLVGFFGCTYAGLIPAPTCFPRPGRPMPRLDSAARDCQPSVLVADRGSIDAIDPQQVSETVAGLPRVATDAPGPDSPAASPVARQADDLALLQYTSGSTSDPKGVMIRHRHLLANLEAIRQGFHLPWQPLSGTPCDCGVFWLPAFHDMGLIGGILEPLYVGGHTVLMSPRRFLMRPVRWLEAISRFRATISGAPNFAYQLCADRIRTEHLEPLDLSHWSLAFCGAEPVSPATLKTFSEVFEPAGFEPTGFYPCYGLAEATLLAAGGDGPGKPVVVDFDRAALGRGEGRSVADGRHAAVGSVRSLVACGTPALGMELAIADPASRQRCAESQVGEIWLRGASVAAGYWNRPQENAETFAAELADGEGPYFRTGDLGMIHGGQLYVTGRVKDVIIIRGRNHYPQDIEATVRGAVGDSLTQTAAFAIPGAQGDALAVVSEIPRRLPDDELPELVRQVRRAVIEDHEVDPRRVVLVRPGSVPLTTSGKVQRSACHEMLDRGELKVRHDWERKPLAVDGAPLPVPEIARGHHDDEAVQRAATTIERWLMAWLVQRADVREAEVDRERPLAEYGLDSLAAVELSSELEDWLGIELTPVLAWNYPTPAKLARYLAETLAGGEEPPFGETPSGDEASAGTPTVDEAGFEDLLNEIESLSDDEIENAFATKRHP